MPLTDAEKTELRKRLHDINNSLNALGMQLELARLHFNNGNGDGAEEALAVSMRERRHCSEHTRAIQSLFELSYREDG